MKLFAQLHEFQISYNETFCTFSEMKSIKFTTHCWKSLHTFLSTILHCKFFYQLNFDFDFSQKPLKCFSNRAAASPWLSGLILNDKISDCCFSKVELIMPGAALSISFTQTTSGGPYGHILIMVPHVINSDHSIKHYHLGLLNQGL